MNQVSQLYSRWAMNVDPALNIDFSLDFPGISLDLLGFFLDFPGKSLSSKGSPGWREAGRRAGRAGAPHPLQQQSSHTRARPRFSEIGRYSPCKSSLGLPPGLSILIFLLERLVLTRGPAMPPGLEIAQTGKILIVFVSLYDRGSPVWRGIPCTAGHPLYDRESPV